MSKNLNPLYEIRTPISGKQGSTLRKVTSRIHGFLKGATEPGYGVGNGNKSKTYLNWDHWKKPPSRNHKAKVLKDLRKGKSPKEAKKAIEKFNKDMSKRNEGWWEQNNP